MPRAARWQGAADYRDQADRVDQDAANARRRHQEFPDRGWDERAREAEERPRSCAIRRDEQTQKRGGLLKRLSAAA